MGDRRADLPAKSARVVALAGFAFALAGGAGAGVLLEATGTIYRLSDPVAPVPLPAGLSILLVALGSLVALRRRNRAEG